MGIEINKSDLVNLVSSTQPMSYKEADKLTKEGLVVFSGNQHNESWSWVKSELIKLSDNQLMKLYQKNKE